MVKKIFCILFITALLTSTCIFVSADNDYLIRLNQEYKPHGAPITFTVNQKNEIYVGYADGQINVYDKNGKFIRAYRYRGTGGYSLFFENSTHIILFTARGKTLFYYNENADLLYSKKASQEQDATFNNIRQRSEFEIGDNTYRAIKRLWYWRIERVDQNNDITIIYETPTQVIWMCFFKTFGFVAFFVIILLIVLVRPLLKRRKLRKEGKEIKYEKPWWR